MHLSVLLFVVILSSVTGVFALGGQKKSKPEEEVQKSLNGNTFETASANVFERYRYGRAALEQCSFKWTEEHERREGDRVVLQEFIDIVVPLERIDGRSIRVDTVKNSGYAVPFVTKALKNGIVTLERIKWGDNLPTTASGFTSGRVIYFRDRIAAQTVARNLRSRVRSCQRR